MEILVIGFLMMISIVVAITSQSDFVFLFWINAGLCAGLIIAIMVDRN